MKSKPNVLFDKQNLRKDEEILFAFKPYKKSYMRRNIIFGGKIPFPFFLLWAVIYFGFLLGPPLSSGQYWLFAILVPLMSIFGIPIWIYIYNVICGIKNYSVCENIITTERLIIQETKKEKFIEYEIANIISLTLLSRKKNVSKMQIVLFKGERRTLYSLVSDDVEKTVNIFNDLKERKRNKSRYDKYKTTCSRCGGKTSRGHCIYCGSNAELKEL